MSSKVKHKPPARTDDAQVQRFKQTARELGCDETGEAFVKSFDKAIPPRKSKADNGKK